MTREDSEQIAVMDWSLAVRQKYPELRLLYHVANERKCTPAEGAFMKRKGVKRGVPDLCLPVPRGKYHGLYIELKAPGGRASEDQKWWMKELEMQGYVATVCIGWRAAADLIESYLNMEVQHVDG